MKNKKLIISILSLVLIFSACTKDKDKTEPEVNTKEISTEDTLENKDNVKDKDEKVSTSQVEKEKASTDKNQEEEINTENKELSKKNSTKKDKKSSSKNSKEKVASSKKPKSKKDIDISRKEKEIIRERLGEPNRKVIKEDDKVVIEVNKNDNNTNDEYAPYVGYIEDDVSPTEGDVDYEDFVYENNGELFEDYFAAKSSKDDIMSQIDVENLLRRTDPNSARPPWLKVPIEDRDEIDDIIYSTIPNNSLVIGTEFYDVQPGGQERIDQKNKEWVNVSAKYTGNDYKYNGDGKNIYLAAHLSPYGKEIRNKTKIYFKDNNGIVKKYNLESISDDIPFNTPITGEWRKMFRGIYGRDAIIFQTCEPRGGVFRYYVFIPN